MEGIKKKVGQMAEIKGVTVTANLAEYNEANGTERAIVEFVYCSDDTDGIQALLGSLVIDSSNRGNVIIDLSGRPGDNMSDKLAKLREVLIGQKERFSTYVIPVALLNDDGYTVVNNGERDYSSLTTHYLGTYDDEDEAVASVRRRLMRQVDEGNMSFGSVNDEDEVPQYFAESELIINQDGSIFHLHLKPEQMADKIILVGDPGRVELVASHFETRECEVENREFRTVTGTFHGKRITVQSTGIGCDNIDIVLNEMDALANIDFKTRTENDTHRQLTFVRIGTCGGLQPYTPTGTYIVSEKSIGFDGLLNFYAGRNEVCDIDFETNFRQHMNWSPLLGAPYVIDADKELTDRIAADDMVRGVTIACGGFFGPQGRELRIPLADPHQNEKIESFEYNGYRITNFEMESSAVAGLARLMGHKATTCCMVIANRLEKQANTGYKNSIDGLIEKVLERI